MGDDVVTVSTIIPTYNRPGLLFSRALVSVMAQTMPDWECLIVGDGTDDETARRASDLCEMDSRFRFWNLPRADYPDDQMARWRLGGAAAFGFGLTQARGDWLSYLADDDRYLPRHHELLLRKADNADFVYGYAVVVDRNGSRTDRVFGRQDEAHAYDITQGSYIARRGVVDLTPDPACIERDVAWDADVLGRVLAAGHRVRRVRAVVHDYFAAPENFAFHRLFV